MRAGTDSLGQITASINKRESLLKKITCFLLHVNSRKKNSKRISESRKSLLVEPNPRIREIALVEFGILGFGIRIQLKESGIPLMIGIQSPNFNDKESGIQFLESGIHDVDSRIQGSKAVLGSLTWGDILLSEKKNWQVNTKKLNFRRSVEARIKLPI